MAEASSISFPIAQHWAQHTLAEGMEKVLSSWKNGNGSISPSASDTQGEIRQVSAITGLAREPIQMCLHVDIFPLLTHTDRWRWSDWRHMGILFIYSWPVLGINSGDLSLSYVQNMWDWEERDVLFWKTFTVESTHTFFQREALLALRPHGVHPWCSMMKIEFPAAAWGHLCNPRCLIIKS